MKKTLLLMLLAGLGGCTTIRNGGHVAAGTMDRAERARCMNVGGGAPFTMEDVTGLEGAYEIYLFGDSEGMETSGTLDLRASGESPDREDPLAGAPPVLSGGTDIDATVVGAVVPGPAMSREGAAPGVGVYRSPDGAVFVRLGVESNRRDRTRFDGAHTTLVITSIDRTRFGGSWTSADGADSAAGEFCARRAVG